MDVELCQEGQRGGRRARPPGWTQGWCPGVLIHIQEC